MRSGWRNGWRCNPNPIPVHGLVRGKRPSGGGCRRRWNERLDCLRDNQQSADASPIHRNRGIRFRERSPKSHKLGKARPSDDLERERVHPPSGSSHPIQTSRNSRRHPRPVLAIGEERGRPRPQSRAWFSAAGLGATHLWIPAFARMTGERAGAIGQSAGNHRKRDRLREYANRSQARIASDKSLPPLWAYRGRLTETKHRAKPTDPFPLDGGRLGWGCRGRKPTSGGERPRHIQTANPQTTNPFPLDGGRLGWGCRGRKPASAASHPATFSQPNPRTTNPFPLDGGRLGWGCRGRKPASAAANLATRSQARVPAAANRPVAGSLGRPIFPQFQHDSFQNRIDVPKRLIIPKPQNPIPPRLQPLGSLGVVIRLRRMLTAVQFHYQVFGKAYEIHDIPSDSRLTPEFVSKQSLVSEMPPQRPFGVGGVSSESLGARGGGFRVHRLRPSPID